MRATDHPLSSRRRRLLQAGGVLTAVGLAGCQVNFGSELSERSDQPVNGDVRLTTLSLHPLRCPL